MSDDFDNKIAGICMALLCGMERDAAERVIEALKTFASDRRTPLSERTVRPQAREVRASNAGEHCAWLAAFQSGGCGSKDGGIWRKLSGIQCAQKGRHAASQGTHGRTRQRKAKVAWKNLSASKW